MKLSKSWLNEWVHSNHSTEQLCHVLTMAGLEVESTLDGTEDTVIELSITPNRGDCLSIQGVARDLAACLYTHYITPFEIKNSAITSDRQLTVNIAQDAQSSCPQYFGRVIDNVDLNIPTPAWIQNRLSSGGIKAHNCIVDIMNYVMLELGQPMHAFDLDKMNNAITIRKAKIGEQLVTLDNQLLDLKAEHTVIADNDSVLALAGVMGGLDSGVTMNTRSVFLESAFFSPRALAGVARGFGLQTDSAFRFERGVDFHLAPKALERATQLILEIAGGQAGAVVEQIYTEYLPKIVPITLDYKNVLKLLGQAISIESIEKILQSLGCSLSILSNHDTMVWAVTPPSHRFDLSIEVDLIEEIARIVGYENIEITMPHFTMGGNQEDIDLDIHNKQRIVPLSRFKRALIDMGYTEAITYSFVSPSIQALCTPKLENLTLNNPISSEMSVMRTSLWPGLIGAVQYNQARSSDTIQLFESGLRFRIMNNKLIQERVLSGIVVGRANPVFWKNDARVFDFFDIKGHIEALFELTGHSADDLLWRVCESTEPMLSALHPGQSATVFKKNGLAAELGIMGVLHPKIVHSLSLEGTVLVFELVLEHFSPVQDFKFVYPSKYPSIQRDLSFTLDENQKVGELLDFIKNNCPSFLQKVTVFDIYSGKGIEPGRKSVAIGLTFQDAQRTLVDTEVEQLMQTVIQNLRTQFNAYLRE